ncbi:Uncharacterised protein [[Clostridium] sordellii]|uniref:hypothetical protein n=1 Tax=Paraclostridium sordellii TaxID=1505 RepID=UPI0005E29443|nr:hypothetical protein [Paeniclostridium sordellii]CEQ12144.1 Uncharacterised protein [[Clostridium] sordellii] [Paeniclostridium sordellii]
MNVKLMKKTKGKKLICTTIGILTIGALSPVINPNIKNNLFVSYALTTENKFSNNHKLSKFQNTFFDLIEFMDKDISVENLRGKIKDLHLVKTERLGNNDIVDIYEKNNEQIKIYYNKIDGKESYYARNVEYKINNKSSSINSITLGNLDPSTNKKSISLQVSTESTKDLDKTSKIFKLDKSNPDTYKIYLNLIKAIESKDSFTSKDLVKFNSGFKKLENPYDKDRSTFEIKVNEYEYITVIFNKDEKINTINLSDKKNVKTVKDLIITKTKDSKDIGWDIQKHYKQEYNLTYGKTGHVISVEKSNPDDAKKLFIDFLKEYN